MRYIVVSIGDEWAVIDLPRRGVKKNGTVLALCPRETMANKICTALEARFPVPEENE